MLVATTYEPVPLSILTSDGRTDLFGLATIYDAAGVLVTAVNLDHTTDGLYVGIYTPSATGYYHVALDLCVDVGRTIAAGYERAGEVLEVSDLKTNILRLLGISRENTYIDQTTYDSNNNLTSARVRSYDTAANAHTHGATGLLFQWTVVSVFDGETMSTYKMTRDV
jgi:hypothetical protein